MSELLPGAEYAYPNYIEYIKVTKDNKPYLFEEKQSDEDIKKAQEYVIEWLKL